MARDVDSNGGGGSNEGDDQRCGSTMGSTGDVDSNGGVAIEGLASSAAASTSTIPTAAAAEVTWRRCRHD